jgi:hypothetical protein
LQRIPGFDTCIDRMRHGVLIESTYAELDFGRMLYSSNVDFRFVADGLVVCADAKCKVETTDFSENTVMNALKDARTQFTEDRPSIIFMKFPHHWFGKPIPPGVSLNSIARRFLRTTGRIVSVKFYASHIEYRDKELWHYLKHTEVPNPNNRFGSSRDWKMLPPPGLYEMPPNWKRLLWEAVIARLKASRLL